MSNRGKTVLVVDDYALIVDRLVVILRELDEVDLILSATSYAESVLILGRQVPDIVLLDIHLPDKSGIDLLSFIKDKYPCVKVIMISNQNNATYKSLCQKLGADYFIDKSNDFEMIPSLIASLPRCSGSATESLSH
jgi:DNA-binding NarL/FixJ family response regulator